MCRMVFFYEEIVRFPLPGFAFAFDQLHTVHFVVYSMKNEDCLQFVCFDYEYLCDELFTAVPIQWLVYFLPAEL